MAKKKLLTKKQLINIQNIIKKSEDCSDYGKKVIIWLFNQMYILQSPILLNFRPRFNKMGQQVSYGIHDMNSSTGSTHLGTHIKKLGCEFHVQFLKGYNIDGGLEKSRPGGYIILISELFKRPKTVIKPNFGEINKIKLS